MHFRLGDTVYSLVYGRIEEGKIIGVSYVKLISDNIPVITADSLKRSLGTQGEYYAVYFHRIVDYRVLSYYDLFSSVANLISYIGG